MMQRNVMRTMVVSHGTGLQHPALCVRWSQRRRRLEKQRVQQTVAARQRKDETMRMIASLTLLPLQSVTTHCAHSTTSGRWSAARGPRRSVGIGSQRLPPPGPSPEWLRMHPPHLPPHADAVPRRPLHRWTSRRGRAGAAVSASAAAQRRRLPRRQRTRALSAGPARAEGRRLTCDCRHRYCRYWCCCRDEQMHCFRCCCWRASSRRSGRASTGFTGLAPAARTIGHSITKHRSSE